MNLFELNDNYKQIADRDDLDPTVLKDTLDAIQDDRKTKLDNLATWADRLKSEIDFMNDKKKSWEEEITYRKNKLKWIKKYITNVLDDAGIKKMATENHLLSARNFKASTVIDDTDKIPAEYRNYAKYEGMYDVEKSDIYKALKSGKKVPGAHLKPNRSTVIK
ncbi:siphovirus Gp157 family protein [Limosilactobacillus antri]|uniref:siphovirus Gp157 family protein n=1 Tax=Limosilactobacillus antri TaxID=227943 RepID=UPI001F595860|nr:siphovirus Gp157 family protein [Limosilactobacillus antri]